MRSCSEPAITFAAKGITVSALPRKRFVAKAIAGLGLRRTIKAVASGVAGRVLNASCRTGAQCLLRNALAELVAIC
jgi:hypothetical protein